MTLEEAQKLAEIADTVDSGCCVCVRSVVMDLNDAFPQFEWLYPVEYEPVTVRERVTAECT